MFYIEVQLEKDGNVIDAKLAHLGEAPVVKLIFSVYHLLVVSHLASSWQCEESFQLCFGLVTPASLCMTPDASSGT